MNNQTIIELKESDVLATNYNIADWENTINDNKLTLFEGDSISLKGAFIDSVAQNSGRITLEPDDPTAPEGSNARSKTTISADFVHYIFNWGTSKGTLNDFTFIPANQTYASGRPFVLCDRISLGGPEICTVSGITFKNFYSSIISGNLKKSPANPTGFFLEYTNPAGKRVKLQFNMNNGLLSKTGYTGDGSGPATFTLNQKFLDDNPTALVAGSLKFPFLAIKNAYTLTDVNGNVSHLTVTYDQTNTVYKVPGTELTGGALDVHLLECFETVDGITEILANTDGDLFQPRISTLSFQLDARDYAPDELAREISKGFTQTESELYIEDQFAIVDNPLLTTSRSLQVVGDAVVDSSGLPGGFTPIPAGNPNTPPFFARDDGGALMHFVPDSDNYIVGTTQFDFEFNQNVGAEGIFQFVQINTPLVDGDGNSICKCLDQGTVAGAGGKRVKYIANKNGGIAFTNLSPIGLWRDQMKFDTNKLITKFVAGPKQTLDALTNVRLPIFNLVDGQNVTGTLKSIDIPFDKNTSFDLVQSFPFDVKSPLQNVIDAADSLQDGSSLDSGYYLIEITSNFFTEKIGSQMKRNIMGIVSRFYQQDSFTSSIDGEGTLEYIHKGEPIHLNSFRCRVLTPEHELAQGLKDNNTIFLQINRAN